MTSASETAVAVLDASLAYGASRWYRGVHDNQEWEHRHKYRAEDDKILFYEFLHNLIFYEEIYLDCSSVSAAVSNEILDLFARINAQVGRTLVDPYKVIAPYSTWDPVVDHVCNVLMAILGTTESAEAISKIPVPWAYRDPAHIDRRAFFGNFNRNNIDIDLIPFAIFAYRGLCYSGYANNLSKKNSVPSVYLAAPGRMQALGAILSRDEINDLQYPRQAYAELAELLKLPPSGYDFSHLKSLTPPLFSELTHHLYALPPDEALDCTLHLRSSHDAQVLREHWAQRVWRKSNSAMVGPYIQGVSGSSIGGDLTMIIHASAGGN